MQNNFNKIINDPVYGFITIRDKILFDLIQHPYYQRLRRINQLGLTSLVYPGANHTRFQHAIGAMYLMYKAIDLLKSKGNEITEEERLGALIAILLHDIGHGPFSHTLEHSLMENISHEEISLQLMHELNQEFEGKLTVAIEIFTGKYPKKFLHQLVSGQLDMDRLDYLKRDSFFSGVSEGVIGSERIIKMLNLVDDELVVEEKGIYSIEKFIIARSLMYWQVYLHKTVLSGEYLLMKILKRAKEISLQGVDLPATQALKPFLINTYKKEDLTKNKTLLNAFTNLDDFDVLASIKMWINCNDKVMVKLCQMMMNRTLFKAELKKEALDPVLISRKKEEIKKAWDLTDKEVEYFVFTDSIESIAYTQNKENSIKIVYKNGDIKDLAEAADILTFSSLSQSVSKNLFCYPKHLNL
jgi:HD superfamily phosphohydrolase